MILDPRGVRRFSPPNPKTLKILRFFDVGQFFEPKTIEKPKVFQCFLALSPEASGLKPKKPLKTFGFFKDSGLRRAKIGRRHRGNCVFGVGGGA